MKELLYNELLIWYEFRWSDNGFNEFHGSVHHIIVNEKHQLDATSVSIYFN